MLEVLVATAAPRPAASLAQWLHPDEPDRPHRPMTPIDRDRSLTGRALLRTLVARATGRPAEGIAFERNCPVCGGTDHGRPRVVGDAATFTSVAHAGDVVVAAVARAPLGVDVERVDAARFGGFDAVALTPLEGAQLAALGPGARPGARAALWVRKEALLKRHELGLTRDPRSVGIGLGEPARVLDDPVAPGERVALVDLAVAAGYRAALAVRAVETPFVTMLDPLTPWAATAPPGGRASG
ncbi:MAG TPA: 4'-phosphopantetheinyl transferase superfamily protein [Jatrophihabitans sp.]|uniref:4'-phosphopantetheinyl transferase family protein n=1 Tax=Jatrophihabitans sp. TaxID=1932789 RepID=UPI002DF99086|nr:4'-phosphopantetheinyl transferase superfamily protein [Jatrophihabitans sp.]